MTLKGFKSAIALAVFATAVLAGAQTVISNETLVSSTFVVLTNGNSAVCNQFGCKVTTGMIGPTSITCPGSTGQTCTLQVSLSATLSASLPCTTTCLGSGSSAFYQFLVDNAPPSIGPSDQNGDYLVQKGVVTGNSEQRAIQTSTASVLGSVTNSASDTHQVMVNVGCLATINQQGCKVTPRQITMRVDVFQP